MSAVYAPGVMPRRGDQVLITPSVAPATAGTDTLTVHWTQPCDTHGWAYLTGAWSDGRAGRVMVWVDRILVHRITTTSS